MPEIKRIHHLALLVADLEAAIRLWQDTLGVTPSRVSDIPEEAARSAFLPLGGSQIELVQPATSDSGLSRYLEKHGPGMHHVCLEVEDLEGLLQQLKDKGIQLINEQPKVGNNGRLYAFIHPRSTQGVLIELYQQVESP
jgi:methylmalonyl-CoA/ethylmalonyl-CoA epimerase